MDPTLIAMRGLPGSGKTTLAEELAKGHASARIFSADDLFTGTDGIYRFDAGRISEAHAQCFRRVCDALRADVPLVIVDNTNLSRWELSPYALAASAFGYTFVIHETLASVDACAARNLHGVPRATIERMGAGVEAPLPWWTIVTHG